MMAMSAQKAAPAEQPAQAPVPRSMLRIGALVGSGDRIGAFVLPFVLIGVALNLAFADAFSVGGPPLWLQVVSAVVVGVLLVVWAWSVVLILTKVRAGELVTTGPYSLVKVLVSHCSRSRATGSRRSG